MNSIHTLTSYSFDVHFNVILPSTTTYPTKMIPSGFPIKISYALLLTIFGCITITIFDEEYKFWSSSVCSFQPSYCYICQVQISSAPCSQTLSVCSFSVWDQVSHSYKPTCRIIALCILVTDRRIRPFWTEWLCVYTHVTNAIHNVERFCIRRSRLMLSIWKPSVLTVTKGYIDLVPSITHKQVLVDSQLIDVRNDSHVRYARFRAIS